MTKSYGKLGEIRRTRRKREDREGTKKEGQGEKKGKIARRLEQKERGRGRRKRQQKDETEGRK